MSRWLSAAALAAAAAAAYGLLLGAAPFYDDTAFLEHSPLVAAPARKAAAAAFSRDYFSRTDERSWQPGVTVLEWASGGNPAPVRALALAAWVLAGLMLAALARRLGAAEADAALAGLLLVLFPAATEALAVASFSGHVFSLAAVLGFLLLFDDALSGARSGAWAAAVLAAGLCFKESALAALPAGALLAWARGRDPRRAGRAAAVTAAVYLVWRFAVLIPAPGLGARSFPRTAALPWEAFGWHLRMLLWPSPLCLERTFSPGPERAARLLLPAAFAGAGWACRRRPGTAFALAWLAAAASPQLHVVPFANLSPAADRYLLAPTAGFVLFLALAGNGRPAFRAALLALALAWGVAGARRSAVLRDADALGAQTAACAPAHPRALAFSANRHYGRGRYAEAEPLFARAFALDPGFSVGFFDAGLWHASGRDYVAGLLRLRRGDPAAALPLLTAAGFAPDPAAAAAALEKQGEALAAQGRPQEARRPLAEASRRAPGWPLPLLQAGLLDLAAARHPEAEAELAGAEALARGLPRRDPALLSAVLPAHARALEALGRWHDAGLRWEEAAGIDQSPAAWLAAAEARLKAGEPGEPDFRGGLAAAERALAGLAGRDPALARELEGLRERARAGLSKGARPI